MRGFATKVYIVQRADEHGDPVGPILAAKLTFLAAHQIAKDFAPAKVSAFVADKSDAPNFPGSKMDQWLRNRLQKPERKVG